MTSAVVLCLGYILGLLSSAADWGKYAVLALGVAIAAVLWLPLPRRLQFLKTGPKPRIWLAAGIIGFLATFYFQFRVPQPGPNDISNLVPPPDATPQEQVVTVRGQIVNTPNQTRSKKARFWLEAMELEKYEKDIGKQNSHQVTGKLYVTVPLLQATGRYPGQVVSVTGKLYEPKVAANPGAFNFKTYLAKQGGFAGLAGRRVDPQEGNATEEWGFWQVRRRIVMSQVRWLGVPEGPLVSGIVLGRRAVDIPYDIRDQFIRVGLAHTLAASGFHVSLLLWLVVVLTKRFPERVQFSVGVNALAIYAGLTGLQPSVLRADVMGIGALIALVSDRQVKPLGSLLLAAIILLLLNPLWIWDVGFELSFLATLGLLVTVPPLMKRLDWLPPAIATLIAVPLAAMVWTLPLQLYVFYQMSPYSILVNVLTSLPIAGITIGGFISGLAGVIWPPAGSALAWLLYYPIHFLIEIVQFFNKLPGSSIATGNLSLLQLLILYGLIVMVWLIPWWHKKQRWLLALLFAVALVAVPVSHAWATKFKVTVLQAANQPVLTIQNKGEMTLVYGGYENIARYTVLPFLRREAANKIDWGIAISSLGPKSGWPLMLENLGVKKILIAGGSRTASTMDASQEGTVKEAIAKNSKEIGSYEVLPVGETVQAGSTAVKLVNADAPVVQLEIGDQTWLWAGKLKVSEQKKLANSGQLSEIEVLWWSGGELKDIFLEALNPKVAIATSDSLDEQTEVLLERYNINIHLTGADGAVQWTPERGFEKATAKEDSLW
ncbi:MAG: DUF4131 domain-containing protein [Oscillatoria sp. SIO1A7]|nr:DUF4131 domain-containing protein [Oscillatoria sp. SIO1A7]